MKSIAHRGWSNAYRDNSIDALKAAVERGYDGIELDVQLCATGELILHHDLYIGNHFIADLDYDDIKKHDLCTLEDAYYEIPELSTDLIILLDIKGSNLSIVDKLVEFYDTRPTDNVTFCSFNRKIIYSLPHNFMKGSTFETTFHVSEYSVITMGLSAVIIHWTCLAHDFIAYCRSKDIDVYTYTHKIDKDLEHMYKYRVSGIITNGF